MKELYPATYRLHELLLSQQYRPVALQKTCSGHFQVMASINGIDTNFIVDTGAAKTVVDLAFAREYDLEVQETNLYSGGLGTSGMVLYKIKKARLLISEFALFLPEIYAIDLRHVRQSLHNKGIAKPASGIIGADALIHHKAIIDYANELLYLQSRHMLFEED